VASSGTTLLANGDDLSSQTGASQGGSCGLQRQTLAFRWVEKSPEGEVLLLAGRIAEIERDVRDGAHGLLTRR